MKSPLQIFIEQNPGIAETCIPKDVLAECLATPDSYFNYDTEEFAHLGLDPFSSSDHILDGPYDTWGSSNQLVPEGYTAVDEYGLPEIEGDTGIPLETCYQYEGCGYGTKPGTYNCVTFVWQIFKECGYCDGLSPEDLIAFKQQTMISNVPGEKLSSRVANADPSIQGPAGALISQGMGQAVDATELQPGDVVQYWYKTGGQWVGHAGIVESVNDDGSFNLYGAHSSKGRVCTLNNRDPNNYPRFFAARPNA